ncbi:MAG: glycosyltransferase family 2 protein [bacterium]|nr:glycosyltransferase family 2 protein [bacterium]
MDTKSTQTLNPTLSVAMLAHNESEVIEKTLQSVQFANEIVLVDAESTDNTAEIAQAYGAKIITRPNLNNLNINKNIAIDACTSDWVLYLDADERISKESQIEILAAIQTTEYNAYFLPRLNRILGKPLRFGGVYPDWQLRLIKRGQFRFPEIHIHERMVGTGKIGKLKHPIHHETYPHVDLLIRKLKFNAQFEAEHAWKNGVRPSFALAWQWLFWKPFSRAIERYIFKLGFLNGFAGIASVTFDAMNFIVRYLYLMEWHRSQPQNRSVKKDSYKRNQP